MLEVVEEWLQPLSLLYDIFHDGIDFVLRRDELQDSRE